MTIFNPNKLEKTLIKNWTEFTDARKLIELASSTAEQQFGHKPPNIQNLKITRFEIINSGFVIWIDYIINNHNDIVNITIEMFTDFSGNVLNTKVIY